MAKVGRVWERIWRMLGYEYHPFTGEPLYFPWPMSLEDLAKCKAIEAEILREYMTTNQFAPYIK